MGTFIEDRRRWWCVIEYEVCMLRWLNGVASTNDLFSNVFTEGRVLHTRNLCDFGTSPLGADIKPSDLFDNYHTDPRYENLKRLKEHLLSPA
jgi:hypothetical protein